MIILYFIYALGLGGSALDVIKDDVKTYVVDPARANEVVVVLDEVEGIMSGYEKQIDEIHVDIERLNADYDSSDEQYNAVQEKGHEIVVELRSRILEKRFKMKELMTREEWIAVFPPLESR